MHDQLRDCTCEVSAARQILLNKGWLSLMPSQFQQDVLNRCRLRRYQSGTLIHSVGDPCGGIYGVAAGSVAVSVAPRERGPYIVDFGRPGMWFGEAAVFTGQPYSIGLRSTQDTVLFHLSRAAIQEIVGKDPSAWRLFALIAIDHLDVAVGAADDLMIRDDFKRFVAILLSLGDCRLPSSSDSALMQIQIDINQENLSAIANLARTTVNAFLRQLKSLGLIELSYRSIRILSPHALRAILSDHEMNVLPNAQRLRTNRAGLRRLG
jgi:CRP/FNR family transcriptional regulator, cyclic AMP receptor protein